MSSTSTSLARINNTFSQSKALPVNAEEIGRIIDLRLILHETHWEMLKDDGATAAGFDVPVILRTMMGSRHTFRRNLAKVQTYERAFSMDGCLDAGHCSTCAARRHK
jgi:hypothetical protein